jgi:peptidoglycan/xylan/chitin deacetylase (PgdA/CDA1 family)/CelD/BcsL family acetyltransferase involved in cellulose biosynthesis
MRVVEVRQEADLIPLRAEWDRLVCQSGSRTIFLTWEWMTAWWSAYGTPDQLRILTLFDNEGVLRGIAPLREQSVRQYGRPVRALSFVGDGSIGSALNDSDYLDFIVEPGYEKQAMETIEKHCAGSFPGRVLLLNEIPDTSPNLGHLRELAASHGTAWKESDVPCATVRLPENWEDYLRTLQSRFRTKVRSTLRNLEGRPEVRMQFCTEASQLDRLLPVLFDLHQRRWAREGKPGVFAWDRKRDFYFTLSRKLLERRWLRFSWLEWNDRILACQYGFEYGGTYFQLQEGYEPDAEHWNPGVGLRAWTIREFLKEGLKEYDFMGGVSRHKTDWGAQVKLSKRLVLTRDIYPSLLFRRFPEWEGAAREAVRKVAPKSILDRRGATASRPQAGGREWLRGAAASCYFHAGVGSLMRPLRKRYQLVTEGGGKRSLKRRTHGSARILYYHRVNNNTDPFSDAISTQLFEEQVRYLASHYKVARLGDIMKHLEDGDSSEMLVGITFDDGYADNYWNAFPILQKYGVPASIFLTTGGLDSDQRLWFERLADAVRETSREFLDLEMDIPRRFWMRTLPERVDSNGRIFALLRTLKNSERTYWVKLILDQLGVKQDAERGNGMLSWDQVRTMNAKGIDFGGHTVTHPFLSKLTEAEAAWEVSECKRRIEQEVQQPAHYFAYPNGREEDFAVSNKEVLRAAGYRGAVTTIWGLNDKSTDPMALRRGGPWESSAALFAAKLDWYQLVNQ